MANDNVFGEHKKVLAEKLRALHDTVFIRVFRRLLDLKAYPYPDEEVLKDKYLSGLVLLADIPLADIDKVLEEETREKQTRRPLK